MALTDLVLSANTTKPKDVKYLVITMGDSEGLAATLSTTAPENGVSPQIIEISSDTDYYWSYQSGQTAADGTMVKVLARQIVRCEVTGAGLNIYMRSSSGTAKMSVVQV